MWNVNGDDGLTEQQRSTSFCHKRRALFDCSPCLIVNRTLNLRLRLSRPGLNHRFCVFFSTKRLLGATVDMSRLEKLCLQWNDFQEPILSCCKELKEDRAFTDE